LNEAHQDTGAVVLRVSPVGTGEIHSAGGFVGGGL